MATLALRYAGDSGLIETRVMPFNSIRGLNDPDKFELVPPVIAEHSDGYLRTHFVGFRRIITIDYGVLQDRDVHEFLLSFLKAERKSIAYFDSPHYEDFFVVPTDPRFESEWVARCKLGKKFVHELAENVIRDRWIDYSLATDADVAHTKCKVEVSATATETSPERFETNTGKLLAMENGESWPSLSLLSWTIAVAGKDYQGCKIFRVGDMTNNGSNAVFYLALDGAGAPASDGKYYCDIILQLQPR